MIKVTDEEIARLPHKVFRGPIVIINNSDAANEAAAELALKSHLGFDIESPPVFVKNVYRPPTLLQLATAEKAWLVKLKQIDDFSAIAQILADEHIIKAGVAIARDLTDLQHVFPFNPAGFVELSTLSSSSGIANNGLRGLTAACLGFKMSKKARLTNWGRSFLSSAQVSYAATDAWCSCLIYEHLVLKENGAAIGEKRAEN